jgi:hypothetical protein
LNVVNGLVAIIGFIPTVASFVATGIWQWILLIVGLAIIAAVVLRAIIHSLPGELMTPASAEAKGPMTIAELDRVFPPVPKVGFIGWTKVGKLHFETYFFNCHPQRRQPRP